MNLNRLTRCVGLFIALTAGTTQLPAAERILLGQSAEFGGQALIKENILGAQAYFAAVNARGGIHGRQIELISLDDNRDNERTLANTRRLIEQDSVIGLFGYRSTPSVEAILPLVDKERIALIAPFSGAHSLRHPHRPTVFHLRASYRDETAEMVHILSILHLRRVALFYQNDSFGEDGLAGMLQNLSDAGITPLVKAGYDRKTLDVQPAVRAISGQRPDAVLMACTPSACKDFIRQTLATGQRPQFMMLSNASGSNLSEGLGKQARGIGIMQVMPHPANYAFPVVREFRSALRRFDQKAVATHASLEGFVAAKLVCDALQMAGPAPTRQKLVSALQAMKEHDLGGIPIRYTPGRHLGTLRSELSVLGPDGQVLR